MSENNNTKLEQEIKDDLREICSKGENHSMLVSSYELVKVKIKNYMTIEYGEIPTDEQIEQAIEDFSDEYVCGRE